MIESLKVVIGICKDLMTGEWVDQRLPRRFRPYARLIRLDKPIGTWLLLLPCWWSVALGFKSLSQCFYFIMFAKGAIVMRGAGCIINDMYDRKLDASVERTRHRPLASGELSMLQASYALGVLLLIGFIVLCFFNRFTIYLGAASLILVVVYPLMKRITYWPQLFLGITFNWGALLGGAALWGHLSVSIVFLYLSGIFWTLGYDTIYAHQDKSDDIKFGVRSTAVLFGDRSKTWVTFFYAMMFIPLLAVGLLNNLNLLYYSILAVDMLFVVFQIQRWNTEDSQDCFARFKANRDVGLIVCLAILLGRF